MVAAKLVRSHSRNSPIKKILALIIAVLAVGVGPAIGDTGGRSIDRAHSTLTVYVYKTGILSTLAHNHEIEAPIESGEIKGAENAIELRVIASKLRVLDTEASDDTRAKIQATMLGAEVLAVDRLPEIHFQSTGVESRGPDHWMIRGNLNLHGQIHPISFEAVLKNGLYEGTVALKQSDFGITPVKVAGGTIKVKDEIKLAFSIALLK